MGRGARPRASAPRLPADALEPLPHLHTISGPSGSWAVSEAQATVAGRIIPETFAPGLGSPAIRS